jgi:large subunit ribosomal protein L4
MLTFDVYNQEGAVVGTVDRPVMFQQEVDQRLIHRYLTWVRTMLRDTISSTKTRGEVSGGGKKPWKQKGTGRARVGSSRTPLWRHGGVVFGPTTARNWHTRMPRTERRKALFSALSAKANGGVVVLDSWTMEAPRTKSVIDMLGKFSMVTPKTKVLHVSANFEPVIFKSTANLGRVTSKTVQAMNIEDVLGNDVVFLTKADLAALEQHFTTNTSSEA